MRKHGSILGGTGSHFTSRVQFPQNDAILHIMRLERITVDPNQMGGVPCIRRLRIPVATVVGMIADGMTEGDVLGAYPDLEADDIRQALKYAAEAVRERELPIAVP